VRSIAVISAVAVLAVAAVALGSGDDDALSDVQPPAPATEQGRAHAFDVEELATGLNRPTYVGAAPGDQDALWVLEQPGRVIRLHGDERRTVLDLTDRVRTGSEQGLIGIAFHPDYATSGALYLHYTDLDGDTRVIERSAGRERELLRVDQPEENHNGGQLAFGPDGRLYLGLGDGGGAFDPRGTAQDPDSLLGKVVATDVGGQSPRWEPVVTGLRNPWRFSFDNALGDIWIADVGQDDVEEVNRVQLELDEPPKNLGWSAYEGTRPVDGRDLAGDGEVVWPVAAYGHGETGGCSITGGLVYGGMRLRSLSRRYVYGDFCSGALWSLKGTPGGGAADVRRERAAVPQLTHIGVDGDGELVFASASGDVYRAIAPAGSPAS
jgi:glucose/arabinose dehydrogenase